LLIDGNPRRAPWIDLADLDARGAVVVWAVSGVNVLPAEFRKAAGDAPLQPPFKLPFRHGQGELEVGWAILWPRE
jgi:hypothetical protein